MINTEILNNLKEQGVDNTIINSLINWHKKNNINYENLKKPSFRYYGKDVLEKALSALLSGANILLVGSKATGKNVLAENLAYIMGRPIRNISFNVTTDSISLLGTDIFKNNEVVFRKGSIATAAENGEFAILDEINMAKNDAIAVLHATLDYRREIDIPGYDTIFVSDKTRFIGTMNYGYMGTKELNEALASRFLIIDIPPISSSNLEKLINQNFPYLKPNIPSQLSKLFYDLQEKNKNSEISDKAIDLRGMFDAIKTIKFGISPYEALNMGLTNKSFDEFEKEIIRDLIKVRFPKNLTKNEFIESIDSYE